MLPCEAVPKNPLPSVANSRQDIQVPSGTIHITKLAAVARQLRAAIRMYFAEEDELAVHTVASAAYRLIADLKRDRGGDVAADSYQASVFYVIRDLRRGTLPEKLTSDPEFMAWANTLAEQLPITANSKYEDVKVSISTDLERDFWRDRNRTANFLKHADRDVGSSIVEDEVNNELLLMQCYEAYKDVAHDELGDEGIVFQAFVAAGNEALPLGERDQLIQRLSSVDLANRRTVCSRILTELKGHNKPEPKKPQ